jgi:hypothetical protein
MALQAAARLVCGFSVKTIETVQNIPEAFDAFIRFLCAIRDLSIQSNIMLATVAENDLDSDIMLRG